MSVRGRPALAPLELALALLFVFMVLALNVIQHKTHVETFGQYAVMVTWPSSRHQDVDVYVRDPHGQIVFYNRLAAGSMQLEHDDQGTLETNYGHGTDFERVVIRQPDAGEYTVNVHDYTSYGTLPVDVMVELWRLRGDDAKLISQKVTLPNVGDERTAFRFRLDAQGDYAGSNRLQTSLLGSVSP